MSLLFYRPTRFRSIFAWCGRTSDLLLEVIITRTWYFWEARSLMTSGTRLLTSWARKEKDMWTKTVFMYGCIGTGQSWAPRSKSLCSDSRNVTRLTTSVDHAVPPASLFSLFQHDVASSLLFSTPPQYTVLYCTTLSSTPLYPNALYSTVLHCYLTHSTPMHCTLLYYTVLNFARLHSLASFFRAVSFLTQSTSPYPIWAF